MSQFAVRTIEPPGFGIGKLFSETSCDHTKPLLWKDAPSPAQVVKQLWHKNTALFILFCLFYHLSQHLV